MLYTGPSGLQDQRVGQDLLRVSHGARGVMDQQWHPQTRYLDGAAGTSIWSGPPAVATRANPTTQSIRSPFGAIVGTRRRCLRRESDASYPLGSTSPSTASWLTPQDTQRLISFLMHESSGASGLRAPCGIRMIPVAQGSIQLFSNERLLPA